MHFDLAEFRRFWTAVHSLATVQLNLAKIESEQSEFPSQKVLLRMSRAMWIEKLSVLTQLDHSKIEAMIALFVFHPEDLQSDLALQPFVKLQNDDLILSNFLAKISSAEDNLFAIWKTRNPQLYGSIASRKEDWWVRQKRPEIEEKGFLTRGQVGIRGIDGQLAGDIDLFIFDIRSQLALCCQLKWFLLPDRFRESNLDKVMEAVQQALVATDWLKADLERAQATLGIRKKHFREVEILPIVISRNWMLNGIKWSDDVPIISEALFDCLLQRAPGDNPLRSLWECAKQRTYLPILGEDFSVCKRKIHLGEACFEYERLESSSGSKWKPDRITFPSLA